MTLQQYARYLFLLQYHLRNEHDGKQRLVDGKSQFILDEQLNYPICMACKKVISPRSINMALTEEVMERYASWSCRRRWSAGDRDYSVAQLAKFPQEIVWTHDYNEAGELVCTDPHYANGRAQQLHEMFEMVNPSAQYTPPVRSFDPLPENTGAPLWVIMVEVNGIDGDTIDTPVPDGTPVKVCVSDGLCYTVPLGTRMYLSDRSVVSVQSTLSGQVKAFIQKEASNGEEA